MSEPVSLSEGINTTLSSVPEKASVVWKNRPRTYYSTYRPPDGVRYGTAPWYMQYFDKMYGQKKEKKSVFENPWLWVLGGVGLLGFFLYKNKKDTTTTTDPTSGGGISETVIGIDDTSDIPLIPDYLTQETQTPNTGYTTPITYPSFVPTGKQDGAPMEYVPQIPSTKQQTPTLSTTSSEVLRGSGVYLTPEAQKQLGVSNSVFTLPNGSETSGGSALSALTSAQSSKTVQNAVNSALFMANPVVGLAATAGTAAGNAIKSAVSSMDTAQASKTVQTVANAAATTAAIINPIGIAAVAGNAAVNLAKSAVSALTSATQTKQTSTPKTTPPAKKTSTPTTPTKTPTFTVKSATSALNSAKNSKTTGKSNEKPRGYGVVH